MVAYAMVEPSGDQAGIRPVTPRLVRPPVLAGSELMTVSGPLSAPDGSAANTIRVPSGLQSAV
jgi:hypothetical protein